MDFTELTKDMRSRRKRFKQKAANEQGQSFERRVRLCDRAPVESFGISTVFRGTELSVCSVLLFNPF